MIPREGEEEQDRELEGTPDWVLEVVSNSSVEKDTERLLRNYHRAGIKEYWLVDARGAEMQFSLLIHRKQGYVAVPVENGWRTSRVFGRAFRLTREPLEMGFWQYTLEMQANP